MKIVEKSLLKYRKPHSTKLKYNYKLCMDSAIKRTKREKEEVDTYSEWVKAVESLIHVLINKLKGSTNTKETSLSVSVIPMLQKPCPLFTTNMLLFLQIMPLITLRWCLKIKLGLDSPQCNPAYTAVTLK